ncbi:MAG: bifunctional methionine sulfoxide reductase B/A protein [Candidatus Cloacimonetes bacterium]|jgi:peptide methionine sulfoxide reductase msrA/msrB|nr:bifunctional methionine sulfoxide reductase B/A protein [Candidatus Cloacimonadota bacterium]
MKTLIVSLLLLISVLLEGDEMIKFNELTKEEERVIVQKGTEQPFTGKFYNYDESGTYLCKRCDAPLFKSDDKFDSECGWPSFDDEIEGAVKRIPDADGVRTEITCANCGAHLGHVFVGEEFTDKNIRHCVNSISLNFIPEQPKIEKAIFAGGCFWGVEYQFQKVEGVTETSVGYIGGSKTEPSYKEVSRGTTGHAEAIQITYDPVKVSYEKLIKLFFEIHDFTQVNRQGPDIGEQYRSSIFYTNDEQKEIAKKVITILIDKGYKVATTLEKAEQFWEAEEYHQDYYNKTGGDPYCHIYKKIFDK